MMHGKIKTNDYLYSLNLGLYNLCAMCCLDRENIEHLFNLCPKAQAAWNNVSNILGKNVPILGGISSGSWLNYYQENSSIFMKSIITVGSWFIWKSRCNLIFREEEPNPLAIYDGAYQGVFFNFIF